MVGQREARRTRECFADCYQNTRIEKMQPLKPLTAGVGGIYGPVPQGVLVTQP